MYVVVQPTERKEDTQSTEIFTALLLFMFKAFEK